ncbi:MAG: NADH-quinone oxidoreductase subunit L, partial [Verrucomicrobiota bacterium]
SLVGLAIGVAGAIFVYRGRDSDPINIPLFANRFYLDEIYQGFVRVFQDAVAAVLDIIDRFVIDPLLVRLPALGAMGAGTFLRVFQIGNVQSYAFFFGVAVVALILFLIL